MQRNEEQEKRKGIDACLSEYGGVDSYHLPL